jgi:hypothetical protein
MAQASRVNTGDLGIPSLLIFNGEMVEFTTL